MNRILLIAVLSLIPCLSKQTLAEPKGATHKGAFHAELRGELSRLYDLTDRNPIHLTLRAPGFGMRKLIVRRRDPYVVSASSESAVWTQLDLLQGVLYSRSRFGNPKAQGVGLDIINNTLRLRLESPKDTVRKGRHVSIRFKLPSTPPNSQLSNGRLRQFHTRAPLACASDAILSEQALQTEARSDIEELPSPAAAIYSPTRFLEVSTQADRDFFKRFRSTTNAEIQSILNAAEAVYMSQLGIGFEVIRQEVFTSKGQPLSSRDPLDLLHQFRNYTNRKKQLGLADTYHLFTAMNTQGNVIGLSFVGEACTPKNSFGFTKLVQENIQAIVTAHEFGHTLNATHPGDTLTNPPASLMSAFVRPGNTEFSEFSLNEITSFIDKEGSCLETSVGTPVEISPTVSGGGSLSVQVRVELGGDPSGCNVLLYGATRKKQLREGLLSSQNRHLLIQALPPGNSFGISGGAALAGRGKRAKIFLRAETECPDGKRRFSELASLPLPARAKRRQVLRQLRRR